MAKVFTCPKCTARLKIPDEAAGRRIKCPKCQAPLVVPAANATTSVATSVATPSANKATSSNGDSAKKPGQAAASPISRARDPAFRQQLLASLDRPIRRVRKSFMYPVAALSVTLVMVLLPLVYLALIVAVGYGVYAHLTGNQGMLDWPVGLRGRGLLYLAYIAPAIVGGIAVVFMIKPIFAPPAKQPRTRSLNRQNEPLLFELVDRICDAVGARRPARLDIDACMNASASFRRGMLSMFGSDLVLTVGLPLAAALTVRQFAGILAHEFGHFSQGLGMRLSYVIRSINGWFARVVYERDEWDEWLQDTAADLDFRIGWILVLAQVCVWASRGVLWCLMIVGHGFSGVLLRQMEYDADRCAARLVGNDTYSKTLLQLGALSLSYELAQRQMGVWHGEGVLADNMSDLTMAAVRNMPADLRLKLQESAGEERTSIFDTHPNVRARIANIDREENAGIMRAAGQARDLFTHFNESSRGVTWDFYCEALGPGIKPTDLRSVRELISPPGKPSSPASSPGPAPGPHDAPIPLVD